MRPGRAPRRWPLVLLAAPAGVAIWAGWVALGGLCGFGKVQPLPGIWDGLIVDTRITLPVGMEAYAAFALRVWLASPDGPARRFARASSIGALVLGASGQVAYHLMAAAGITAAPWPVVAVVATLPVAVLGMGAALAHLQTAPVAGVPSPPVTSSAPGALEARPVPTAAGSRGSSSSRPSSAPRMSSTTARPDRRAASGGVRVRELAAEHPKWTQAELAAAAGCSVRTVRRHLSGGTIPVPDRTAAAAVAPDVVEAVDDITAVPVPAPGAGVFEEVAA